MMSDRAIAIEAKRIVTGVRARLEIIAEHIGNSSTMGGLCHFAALGLTQALVSADLPAILVSDGGHSWSDVELRSGKMLVDITATQYGFTAPVFIRMPHERRPTWPRGSGNRWKRLYCAAVKGLEAQKLCQGVADEHVHRPPPAWWSIELHALPLALVWCGTCLYRERERRTAEIHGKTDEDWLDVPHV